MQTETIEEKQNNQVLFEEALKLHHQNSVQIKPQNLPFCIGRALQSLSQIKNGEELFMLMRPYLGTFKALSHQHKLRANLNVLKIDLRNQNIRIEDCEIFLKVIWFNLKELNLQNNCIGSQGCQFLIKGNWPNLEKLYLGNNKIGNSGCQYLMKSNWPNLQQLSLCYNEIGNLGVQFLIQSNLLNLQMLFFFNNKIGDSGAQLFTKSNWPQIQKLYLMHNKIITTNQTTQLMIQRFNSFTSLCL